MACWNPKPLLGVSTPWPRFVAGMDKDNKMFRKSIIAVSLAAFAATAAFAKVDKISEVAVTADLTAIKNEKAAAYWATLPDDLENAIVARLVDRIAEEGAKISVDLREVELASSFERALTAEDAVLVGQVNVSDMIDNTNFDAYELTVTLGTAPMISADGTTIMFDSLDTPEAYQSLIGAFADHVVKKLD